MIVIEILALAAMGIVFVATFVGSARSHTRAQAWATPTAPAAVRTATVAVIHAQDRFAAGSADDIDPAAAA